MSSVHYFQRYSQKENVVTNNTLLLMSRLYSYNPLRLEAFLNEILKDATIDVGVSIQQQTRTEMGSIPDGLLYQKSFKVIIETKLYNNHDLGQLTRHLDAFGNEDNKILLSLSPLEPAPAFQSKVKDFIRDHKKKMTSNIIFLCTTFERIIESYESILSDHDYEMKDLVEDYRSFCAESNLLPETDYTMRTVTCGWTMDENFKFNLYYDPVSRSCQEHKYIGIYRDKCIRGIGEIENIIHADLIDDSLQINESSTNVTDEQKKRIIEVIPHAKETCGYDITRDHKFFLVKKFYPTEYKKTSKGPLRGIQYFNLKKELKLNKLPSIEEIAKKLRDHHW